MRTGNGFSYDGLTVRDGRDGAQGTGVWVVVDLAAGITSVSITRVASSLVRTPNHCIACLRAFLRRNRTYLPAP